MSGRDNIRAYMSQVVIPTCFTSVLFHLRGNYFKWELHKIIFLVLLIDILPLHRHRLLIHRRHCSCPHRVHEFSW